MKELKCGSVIPGCDWHTRANSDAEIIRRACQHMRVAHGTQVISEKMVLAVKAQIEKPTERKPVTASQATLYL